MTLGEKLRRTRLDRGLTQAQVVGGKITRNMLSQIENDLAKPSVRTLEYLASALGVELGWLMSDDDGESTHERMRSARACYRVGDFEGCLRTLEPAEADDEAQLLIALCTSHLAQKALDEERFSDAEKLVRRAEDACDACLYPLEEVRLKTACILLRCGGYQKASCDDKAERLRKMRRQFGSDAVYHLTMVRHHLLQENVHAAEQAIYAVVDLPEGYRAEYLILRGRIAAAKQQYENAVLYLTQAEQMRDLPRVLRRELYAAMELCCRQMEDFKSAYEYAAKQLELGAPI